MLMLWIGREPHPTDDEASLTDPHFYIVNLLFILNEKKQIYEYYKKEAGTNFIHKIFSIDLFGRGTLGNNIHVPNSILITAL